MTNEQTQEEIMDIPSEVLRVAAPKEHSHTNATSSKNGYMSATDKAKLDTIAEHADKTNIIVDSSLPDDTTSTNPVQAKTIMEKINEIKETIITISNTLNPLSTNQAVSGKGIAEYVDTQIGISEASTLKSPSIINSLDEIEDSGIYIIEENPSNIACGNETINIYKGCIEAKKIGDIYKQNVIASNGVEYSRWKNNNSNDWTNWKVYYMPIRQYTKPYVVHEHVYNLEIMEDTKGYTINWQQSLSSDRNYFTTSAIAGEWKDIILFEPALQIDGCFMFSNVVDTCDYMITGGHYNGEEGKHYDSGMYVRSTNGNKKIKGINYSFFVPRNN